MKKSHLRTIALLVCLAFLVSLAPALQSAEKKATKSAGTASLKNSFRILAYLFPMFAPPAEIDTKDARNKDLIDQEIGLNPVSKPTTDAPSMPGPKTKD